MSWSEICSCKCCFLCLNTKRLCSLVANFIFLVKDLFCGQCFYNFRLFWSCTLKWAIWDDFWNWGHVANWCQWSSCIPSVAWHGCWPYGKVQKVGGCEASVLPSLHPWHLPGAQKLVKALIWEGTGLEGQGRGQAQHGCHHLGAACVLALPPGSTSGVVGFLLWDWVRSRDLGIFLPSVFETTQQSLSWNGKLGGILK